MSKNYNRYGEESKKTDKYGMTDEKNENAKTQKKENCYGSDGYDKSSTNRYSDKNRPVHKRLRMCGWWKACIR